MVTTMKPPLRFGVTAPPFGSTNCTEHRRNGELGESPAVGILRYTRAIAPEGG